MGSLRSRLAILAAATTLCTSGAQAQGVPQVHRHEITENHPAQRLRVDVAYPSLSLPGALMGMQGNIRDANAKLAQWAQQQKSDFLGEVQKSGGPPEAPGANELQVDYDVLDNSGRVFSVKFDVMENFVGAAHPANEVVIVNLDLAGQPVTIDNLFGNQSAALGKLAPLVRRSLAARAKAGGYTLFDEGLAPTAANYRNVAVMPTGLRFYFNPAQAAASYVGVLSADVPWSEVRGLLSKDAAWLAGQ